MPGAFIRDPITRLDSDSSPQWDHDGTGRTGEHHIGRTGVEVVAHTIERGRVCGQSDAGLTRSTGRVAGVGFVKDARGGVVLTHIAVEHPHKSVAFNLRPCLP